MLYYTMLYYAILRYTIRYYTILHDTIRYYTTLHYTTLRDTILYYAIYILFHLVCISFAPPQLPESTPREQPGVSCTQLPGLKVRRRPLLKSSTGKSNPLRWRMSHCKRSVGCPPCVLKLNLCTNGGA